MPGYNEQDAKDRLKKLPLAKYDGELYCRVWIAPSWTVRIVDWLKKIIRAVKINRVKSS